VNHSPLSSLHRAAEARFTAPEPGGVLLTYGDVPSEYQAGRESCVLFDTTQRGALRVTGEDAESFLQRITANQVKGLEPDHGRRNLLLDGKGKVHHDFDLRREEDGYHLSTPPGRASALAEAIDMYLFTEAVELTEVTEEHAPLELTGPSAPALLENLLGAAPSDELHHTRSMELDGHPVVVTPLPVAGSLGWRLDAGPQGVELLWRALVAGGATPAGLVVHDILRVEAGRAAWGHDVDENVYPQEARLEDAFSLEKGCYIGQEVVAKIDTYGGLNKCLFGLRVDHDDPIPAGTRLLEQESEDGEHRDLGLITSWAYSFVLDTGMVLGYVKRRNQARGTTFLLSGGDGESRGTATIVELPVREDALPVTGEQPAAQPT
jgi:folate-binding protein YgfZ